MGADSVSIMRQNVISVVKEFFQERLVNDSVSLGDSFEETYLALLQSHTSDDSEVAGIRQLIVQFRPALSSVLQPCEEFDELMTMVMYMFKAVWEGAHRRKVRPSRRTTGPLLPGNDESFNLSFFCVECGYEIPISQDLQVRILSEAGEVDIPEHHGRQMKIRIVRNNQSPEKVVAEEAADSFEPVEILMGHVEADNVEYMEVLSVGIDVGSSTTHLIFSRLTLKRETSFLNITNRFNLVHRKILYQSPIVFTPLLDQFTIDIEGVIEFCEEEYRKAGITPDMVDTGAVIVTGEASKKQNAAEIVNRLSSESGRFVSAVAGVNLESLLGVLGSGMVAQSQARQKTILHVDVGGGTSNMAIASMGQVLTTSCINVGGRLLGIDSEFKIWRIDNPSRLVMRVLGMNYEIGDVMSEEDVRAIAREYARALVEVMLGPSQSRVAKELMMTEPLDLSVPIDEVSFSGGVGELLYRGEGHYDDIGLYLAKEMRALVEAQGLTIVEPENTIRATVIGAGAFSLSVSGSTTYFDESMPFPIDNVPVLPVSLRREEFRSEWFEEEVRRTFAAFDMVEGQDVVALYFKDQIRHRDRFRVFAKAIERALPHSVARKSPIILVFAYDFAKLLGITIRDETSIGENLLCLDELQLEAGDWIDIGAPLESTQAFPITVKSLVFNEDKEYD
jgi:ethanolamine utilization protein EutA